MKKKQIITLTAFALFALVALAINGCGGGGSTNSVLAPSNSAAGTVTAFVDETPEELTAKDAATIGTTDTAAPTTFSGGTTIATSGATFLDMATCAANGCHVNNATADLNKYTSFLSTNHNLAWSKKSATFVTYAAAGTKYCVQCHTVTGPFLDANGNHVFEPASGEIAPFGLTPSTTSGTFGGQLTSTSFTNVNDVPAEFQGIQCENCHGPASLHNGDKTKVVSGFQAWSAQTCKFCHVQVEEWEKSAHAVSKNDSHSNSCTPCHTGEGFVEYANYTKTSTTDDILYFIDKGLRTVNNGTTEGTGAHNVNCVACHDPHDNSNEHQLRLPKEEVCITCHKGRKKLPGDSHAPHHNLQGRVLNGQGIVNTNHELLWNVGSKYLCSNNEESSVTTCGTSAYYLTKLTDIKPVMGNTTCVDCHMYSYTNRAAGIEWLGHTWKPNTNLCKNCHSSMDAGNVIGSIQASFAAKQAPLVARLATAKAALDTDASGTVDSTDTITATQLKAYQEAEWNLNYVDYDGSKGFHNPDFANRAFEYTDAILTSIGY